MTKTVPQPANVLADAERTGPGLGFEADVEFSAVADDAARAGAADDDDSDHELFAEIMAALEVDGEREGRGAASLDADDEDEEEEDEDDDDDDDEERGGERPRRPRGGTAVTPAPRCGPPGGARACAARPLPP